MMGDMTEDKFRDILNQELAKFIGQINRRFDGLEKQVASKADDAKVDKVLGLLDAIAKQQEIDQHERLAMNHQLDRHERWHHQAADKLGMKLDYQEQ
jgi:hypothetical protein